MSGDDIAAHGFRWFFANTMPSPLPIGEPIIINTDLEGGEGVHWITLVRLSQGTRYLYDPLGPNNKRVASDGTPVDSLIKPYGTYVFPFSSQLPSTGHCGYFALHMAKIFRDHIRKNPRATTKTLDSLVVDEFGRSADWGDVRVLQQAFAKKNV